MRIVEFLRFSSHPVKYAEWKLHTAETNGSIVGSELHPVFP